MMQLLSREWVLSSPLIMGTFDIPTEREQKRGEMTNVSLVTMFTLTGLPHAPELDTFLLGIFLVVYVLTVVENLLILLVIIVNPCLHTPMYYTS